MIVVSGLATAGNGYLDADNIQAPTGQKPFITTAVATLVTGYVEHCVMRFLGFCVNRHTVHTRVLA